MWFLVSIIFVRQIQFGIEYCNFFLWDYLNIRAKVLHIDLACRLVWVLWCWYFFTYIHIIKSYVHYFSTLMFHMFYYTFSVHFYITYNCLCWSHTPNAFCAHWVTACILGRVMFSWYSHTLSSPSRNGKEVIIDIKGEICFLAFDCSAFLFFVWTKWLHCL